MSLRFKRRKGNLEIALDRIAALRTGPWTAFTRSTIQSSIVGSYESIQIADVNLDTRDDSDFAKVTTEALDLINKVDPRRFRMVLREIRFVVNTELLSGGRYNHHNRTCEIDFAHYWFNRDSEDFSYHLVRYASVIVHEATHGHLHACGIPYNRRTRIWSERICHREQVRFINLWSKGRFNYTDIIPEFDEARWHYYWFGSRWRHVRDLIRRIASRNQNRPYT